MRSWTKQWMISCAQASKLTSERLDHRLSFGQRLKLRLHLRLCDACRLIKQQIDALHELLRRRCRHEEESPDLTGPSLTDTARRRIADALKHRAP